MNKTTFLLIFCLISSITAYGQVKEITEDESVQQLVKAFGKFSETSWRKTQKTEYFENGKQSYFTEFIQESIKPDKQRLLTIENKEGKINETEIITIGESYYCRTNKETWKKSDNGCGTSGLVRGMGEEVNSKYTVEKSKLNNQNTELYRQFIIYDRGEKGKFYWDYKFWINDKGFILKREIETGFVETKKVLSRMTETSHYNPRDLKIEAPIK